MYKIFEERDLFVGQGNNILAYKSNENTKDTPNPHNGQFKLLMSEIWFFSTYLKNTNPAIVLYIGAFSGSHIITLSKMFPYLIFYAYDPKFASKDSEAKMGERLVQEGIKNRNINIEAKLFDDKEMERWIKFRKEDKRDLYLISDIRSMKYSTTISKAIKEAGKTRYITEKVKLTDKQNSENEDGIQEQMLLQQKWVENIDPTESLLKFRLRFYEKKLGSDDYWDRFEYLDGTVFIQQWVGPHSTECRLVPLKDDKNQYMKRNWDLKFHESAMWYHNNVTRLTAKFLNPANGLKIPVYSKGNLDDRYDSTASAFIVKIYLKRHGISNPEAYDLIGILSEMIKITYDGKTDKIMSSKGK